MFSLLIMAILQMSIQLYGHQMENGLLQLLMRYISGKHFDELIFIPFLLDSKFYLKGVNPRIKRLSREVTLLANPFLLV